MTTLTLDVERLAWQPVGASGISEKILEDDPDTGARTLLLRSPPRPSADIPDRRPQYHPVDEEFLCLAGKFTLEGTHWLTPMTYVHYPAGLAHGFNVDVPDGYEIYLRNSGPVTTQRVDSPAEDNPYFIGDGQRDPIIVSNCSKLVLDAVQSNQLSVITLRNNDRTKEGALIACLPTDGNIASQIDGAGDYLDILVLEGAIQLGDLEQLGKLGYASLVGPAKFKITSLEPTVLMLNYRDPALAGEIEGQAESVRDCVNAYPQI
jgi:hypothetical protein